MPNHLDFLTTEPAPHPGRYLARILLPNYHITAKDVAEKSIMSEEDIQAIIDGNKNLTFDDARKLRKVFGNAANELMRFQETYDFYQTHGQRPNAEEKVAIKNHVLQQML